MVSSPQVSQRPRTTRDGFIDALRAIALIRVVVWHATGNPTVSWVITTMPLMFFVAGSLLFASLDGRSARLVLQRRLKRLLVPFWFFGALVLSACAIVDLRSATENTSLRAGQLWSWIVPLVNPTASSWEAGWASSPLWYLRAYLWILLLSPALMWAWRKSPVSIITASVALMTAAQFIASSTAAGPGAMIWIVGDLGIYGFFVFLGFAHHQGRFDRLSRRDLTEWMCVAVAATVVAWKFTASADGVVNHSYPALLTFGVAWLCAALLARPWLRQLPEVPIAGPALYWMTRRAMSIYLWHSPAIVGAYWILSRAGISPSPAPVIAITAVLVVVASTITGWIEDVAAGRPPELVPLPAGTFLAWRISDTARDSASRSQLLVGAGVGVTLTLLAASWLVQPTAQAARAPENTGSSLALPPAPSGRPDPNAATLRSTAAPAYEPTVSLVEGANPDAALTAIIDTWRSEHGVAGVRLGVSTPTADHLVISGSAPDNSPLGITDGVPVTSITKTMTASIALQLVDEGVLRLDDPISPLAAAPKLIEAGPITLRQLLNHSSGLVPYQQADGYAADQALTAQQAVQLAGSSALEWEPGSLGGYSNSGFLAAGLLIEQTTGSSFEDELSGRILTPLGLDATWVDTAPTQGWVGNAAGGVVSTVPDLLAWGTALYRDKTVLSTEATAEMMSVDAALMSALGAFPVCPCPANGDGSVGFVSIGHNGGSVTMHYAPQSDILIVASFTESFWTNELGQQDVYDLLSTVRFVLAG